MDDYEDHDDVPPCCKSCGKPFVEHMGLQGTCARLLESEAELARLREEIACYKAMKEGFTIRIGDVEEKLKECWELLEHIANIDGGHRYSAREILKRQRGW